MLLRTLIALMCLGVVASAEPPISVKVQRVDTSKGEVEFLLPMHHTLIFASFPTDCDPLLISTGEFYPARLVAGRLHTTRRTGLEVKVKKSARITFRILRVQFLTMPLP